MDFNTPRLVSVYIYTCVNILKKQKPKKTRKNPLLRNLTTNKVFESGKKAGVQPKKFLLEHLR